MKYLLCLGAAAALIVAGSAYAGDYQHDYDCDTCEDSITVELLGTVECNCDITVGNLSFNTLQMTTGFASDPQPFSVTCNGDDPEITVTSLNGGLLGPGGLISYDLLLTGVNPTKTFSIPGGGTQQYEGNTNVQVQLGTVPAMLTAGDYVDTLTVTLTGQ